MDRSVERTQKQPQNSFRPQCNNKNKQTRHSNTQHRKSYQIDWITKTTLDSVIWLRLKFDKSLASISALSKSIDLKKKKEQKTFKHWFLHENSILSSMSIEKPNCK